MPNPRWALCLGLLLSLAASTANATICIIPGDRPAPPHVRPPVRIDDLNIDVEIDDGVARTTLHQVVRNTGGRRLEVQFLLPVPSGATVHSASLKVGEEWVEAEVLSAAEAKRAYRDIVRRQVDPALIEYIDDGLLRTHVFPIPAGTTRELRLELTATLPEDFGAWIYRFPLKGAVGSTPIGTLSIHGEVRSTDPLERPYSMTHPLHAEVVGDGDSASFELNARAPRHLSDLQVILPRRTDGISIAVASTRPRGDDGFVMVRVSPGQMDRDHDPLPRRVVFALDVSGSMQGEKIRQAKRALRTCLKSLGRQDSFALLTYEASVRGLTDGLVRATPREIDRALEQLERERAGGGTNLAGVVNTAMRLLDEDGDPAYVLLLSDGRPTVGVTDESLILQEAVARNRAEARLFTFGVGTDLNTRLMDQLAHQNRATPRYVLPGEDLEVALTNLARQISEPIMTDVKVSLGRAGFYDVLPKDPGDLFVGQELTLLARYRRAGSFKGELAGRQHGERESMAIEGKLARHATNHSYLPKLWATRKIAELSTELRHGERNDPELIEEIEALGTRYGILTEYTSLLMREDSLHPQFGQRQRRSSGQMDSRLRSLGYMGGGSSEQEVGKAAREARALRAPTVAEADALSPSLAWDEDNEGRPTINPTGPRTLAGRVFVSKGSVWVEHDVQDETPDLTIAPFSQAYFDLIDARPELRELLSMAVELQFKLDGKVLAIETGGVEKLPESGWPR